MLMRLLPASLVPSRLIWSPTAHRSSGEVPEILIRLFA
jgi:hypothetical protein